MYIFTEEFKERVRAVYGNKIDKHLERGGDFVGRWLNDNSYANITADEILQATHIEVLKDKARLLKAKQQLYIDWDKPENRIYIKSKTSLP